MLEAVRRNDNDMVHFFVLRRASDWSGGMQLAASLGNRELVNFFIQKARREGWDQYDWNLGLYAAAQGGHVDLMKFFIGKGADELNFGLYYAAAAGHRNAIDYLISRGANNWFEGLRGAKQARNEELMAFFSNKLI